MTTQKTPIDKNVSENLGKTPKRTQHDSTSGNETFYSFVMNNIKELNEKSDLKFDLSKDLNGMVLMCRDLQVSELISRTSQAFCESLIGDKKETKVYEYFVYVPNVTDYLTLPSLEEMEVFYKLRHSEKEIEKLQTNKDKETKDSDLKTISEVLDTKSVRIGVVDMIQDKIESLYRFYGAKEKTGSNMVHCKVKFHDPNNLQFGKFVSAGSEATGKSDMPLKKMLEMASREYEKKAKDSIKKSPFASASKTRDLISSMDAANIG